MAVVLRPITIRPSHPYNAGTEHFGFSQTRQEAGSWWEGGVGIGATPGGGCSGWSG